LDYIAQLKKKKPLASLPTCIDDSIAWISMLLHDYSIASVDMFLLASQLDYDKIASFKLCDVSTSEYEQFRNLPKGNQQGAEGVPESKLPIQKLQYHFMSRKVDPEVIKQAEQDLKPRRLEANSDGLQKYLKDVAEYAKKHRDEQVLALVFCAGHGYTKHGWQCLATNAYSVKDNFYELVNFEINIRSAAKDNPNVYYLCHFACCRETFYD
jgi:hypothetical protein